MNLKTWNIAQKPSSEEILHLQKELNISEPTAVLLLNRGISNFDEAKNFFRPDLAHLHDPFLMLDMDKAVTRILHALKNKEKILIYGDYDVDGTTSVSMVYSFLKEHFPGSKLDFYIPDRYKEGYGVSLDAIEYAKDNGIQLIITLDCGIKAFKATELATSYNIDIIICDHHLPDTILPKAEAILDPKRSACLYPYKELSGCGVGFKLLQALCIKSSIPEADLYKYLDYVTISICADIVPITGENRILAYHGIKLMNQHCRPGIDALKQVSSIKSEINVHHIVFGFAPRINAAGRIEHAKASVEMLIAETAEIAMGYAKMINDNNTTRKDFDSNITQEALEMIESDEFLKSAWSTVLFKNDWNKGVVGIVASRCIEKYHRPTIILTESNGKAVGSARSIPGFDLYKGIGECEELLEQFGGHMHAAGLSLKIENIAEFREKFDKIVRQCLTEQPLSPTIHIDFVLRFDEITTNFFNILKQFAPYGPLNMEPIFASTDVYLAAPIRILKEEHLKLYLQQKGSHRTFEAIGFKMAKYASLLQPNTPFKICFQVMENTFNNQSKLELLLKDIQP